jgi:hypothetical protein
VGVSNSIVVVGHRCRTRDITGAQVSPCCMKPGTNATHVVSRP